MAHHLSTSAGRAVIRRSLIAGSAMTWLLSGAAIAQQSAPAADDAPGVAEIIVTAQKRSENVQKVPIAIAAFSAETLKANNVAGLADLANVTPGLTFTFQSQSGSPFLRGVGNAQTFAGSEAEVQTYIDNVYYASGGGSFTRFNNIARVEVDKGPQGTLFGRNATGGVIQVFTRDPSHAPVLDASVGYGRFDYKEADVYASGGLGTNLAADIAVHYDHRDGWGKNSFDNADVYQARSFAVRSKWVFEPSSDTKLTLIGDYGIDRSELGQAYSVIGAPWSLAPGGPPSVSGGFYDVASDFVKAGKTEQYGVSLKADTKLDDLSLVSISAYRSTRSIGYLDADGTTTPFLFGVDTRKERQASQEFQLLSPASDRLKWILGVYLYYNRATEIPGLSGIPFGAFGASRIDGISTMTTKSAAAFGQATYDLTPTTHITAGVRYTYDHRAQKASTLFQTPAGPSAPPPFLGLGINTFPTDSFKAVTGKLTIAQDIGDQAMIYAGYNRGFKSGTYNNIVFLRNVEPALEPETMDAYEVGFKAALLDRRIRFNAAAFLYKYKNLQVNIFQNLNIALQNAANSSIKGVDGTIDFAATNDTRFQLGFSYLDAKYDDFPNAPLYLINPITAPNLGGGGFGGINISAGDASGKRLPFAPRFSGFASVSQGFDIDGGRIDLSATVKYQSKIYFTPDNLYGEGRYATLAATAKWTAPGGRWDVTLWGRNLTATNSYQQYSLSAYGVFAYPNEPRSYGARVGVHF